MLPATISDQSKESPSTGSNKAPKTRSDNKWNFSWDPTGVKSGIHTIVSITRFFLKQARKGAQRNSVAFHCLLAESSSFQARRRPSKSCQMRYVNEHDPSPMSVRVVNRKRSSRSMPVKAKGRGRKISFSFFPFYSRQSKKKVFQFNNLMIARFNKRGLQMELHVRVVKLFFCFLPSHDASKSQRAIECLLYQ